VNRIPGPDAAPPELPGYQFVKSIGAGGNAQAYLYEQELPRRQVAVKVLNGTVRSETARRRFIAEANQSFAPAPVHADANGSANFRSSCAWSYWGNSAYHLQSPRRDQQLHHQRDFALAVRN
jgi:hypothetical protein